MVGMPGFLARFLTRVFGKGFWDRKYSVQYYTAYSTTGTEKYSFTVLPGQNKKTAKKTMDTNPIL